MSNIDIVPTSDTLSKHTVYKKDTGYFLQALIFLYSEKRAIESALAVVGRKVLVYSRPICLYYN